MIVAVAPEPDVQFLEGVVVHEVELDVLVAAALARGGVGLAEQVEFQAAGVGVGGGRRRSVGFRRLLPARMAALRQRMATSGVRIVSIMAIKKAADAPFGRLRL